MNSHGNFTISGIDFPLKSRQNLLIIMPRKLTLQQRIFIVSESKDTPFAALIQLFIAKFPGITPPTRKAVYNLVKKFKEHVVVTDRQKDASGGPSTGVTFENTVAIVGSVADHPRQSTRRRSANLGIPKYLGRLCNAF